MRLREMDIFHKFMIVIMGLFIFVAAIILIVIILLTAIVEFSHLV